MLEFQAYVAFNKATNRYKMQKEYFNKATNRYNKAQKEYVYSFCALYLFVALLNLKGYICLSVCRFVKGNACQKCAYCFVLSILKSVHFEPPVYFDSSVNSSPKLARGSSIPGLLGCQTSLSDRRRLHLRVGTPLCSPPPSLPLQSP